MVLVATDLDRLGQTALMEFDEEMAQAGVGKEKNLEHHAQRLEAKLEQLYAVAATMARRENTLGGVAAIWSRMVSICDSMAKAILDLQPARRGHAYDRILDLRNICEENRALHA